MKERGSSGPAEATEESESGDTDQPPYTWIIDPLDGTTNFVHGIPHFCTSIAVTRGAALLHGVVVDHVRNEEFTASRGSGARLNGPADTRRRTRQDRRPRSSPAACRSPASTPTSTPTATYSRNSCAAAARYAAKGPPRSTSPTWPPVASTGFFQLGLEPWDIRRRPPSSSGRRAASSATPGRGERFLDSGNVVAANPKIFRAMLRIIRANAVKHGDPLIDG